MKLVINYDFFDAIKDVREPLGPLKIIRNKKTLYTIDFPLFMAVSYYNNGQNLLLSLANTGLTYSFIISMDWFAAFLASKIVKSDTDIYGLTAKRKLLRLPVKLSDINVKTDYDMLLTSELYKTKYKIDFNKDKIPFLLEKKYVLVPSYNFGGKETETSILQEHVVGSCDYVLSVEEYKQEKRRVLVPNNG